MNNDPTQQGSLTGRAAWILFAKLSAFAFGFAVPLLLIRRLSQAEFGLYKQAFLVVTTATTILPLGFGFTAYYFLPREPERRGAVVFNILLFNLVVSGSALVALCISPALLVHILISADVAARDPQLQGQITSLAPLIGVVIVFSLCSAFLETSALANQETKHATFFIIGAQFTKSLLLLSAAIGFGSVPSLLYAALIQGVLQTLILVAYLRKRFARFWFSFDSSLLTRQISYAIPYSLSGLIWVLQTDMHNYVVSHAFGQTTFAIYAVGVFQLPLIGILGESVSSVMIPRVSYLQSIGDTREIIRLAASAMRKLAMVFFPAYAVLLLLRQEFIVALFTRQYLASAPIFAINLTLLPFAILPLDSIVRAYQELGRFVTKMRVAFSIVLAVGLWLAAHFGDAREIIAVAVGIYVTEALIASYKALHVLNVERGDAHHLKDIGKIALATAIAALVTFVARNLMLHFELKAFWLLCACGATLGLVYLAALLALNVPTSEERAAVAGRWSVVTRTARRVSQSFAGRQRGWSEGSQVPADTEGV